MILILPGNPMDSGFPLLTSEQETKTNKIKTKQSLLSMVGDKFSLKIAKKYQEETYLTTSFCPGVILLFERLLRLISFSVVSPSNFFAIPHKVSPG